MSSGKRPSGLPNGRPSSRLATSKVMQRRTLARSPPCAGFFWLAKDGWRLWSSVSFRQACLKQFCEFATVVGFHIGGSTSMVGRKRGDIPKLGTARSSPALSAGSRPALGVWDFWGVGSRTRRIRFLRAELVLDFGFCQSQSCTAEWLRREGAVGAGRSRRPRRMRFRGAGSTRIHQTGMELPAIGGCCHRTLVRARARVETRHRTADSFGV